MYYKYIIKYLPPRLFKNIRSLSNNNNINYCSNLIRKLDYESYLCCLLLPKSSRISAIVLRSFLIEISQIQETISVQNIGLIKLQYWKDSIDQIFLKKLSPQSPVFEELTKIINKYDLSKVWFSRLIESREEQILSNNAFMNINEAEEYYMKSIAPFYILLLQANGQKDIQLDHVIGHISKGQGLVTLMRSVTWHIKRRQVYLPHQSMIKFGVTQQNIIQSNINQNMKDLFFDIAATANIHFEKALDLMKDMPKSINNLFLFATPSRLYLKAIQNKDFNIFDPQLARRNPWLPIYLFYNRQKGTI